MSTPEAKFDDVETLSKVLPAFKRLNEEERLRLLQTVATFFGFKIQLTSAIPRSLAAADPFFTPKSEGIKFSEERSIYPKDFLLQKQPRTDVERIACLAFYLTHYQDTSHFKTLDLSKLNTEAAQPKFANAAKAVDNATRQGYLAPATNGAKQLSAQGEQFVLALPDRDAARAAMARRRRLRKRIPQTVPNKA